MFIFLMPYNCHFSLLFLIISDFLVGCQVMKIALDFSYLLAYNICIDWER
jgi:hypothetical protein